MILNRNIREDENIRVVLVAEEEAFRGMEVDWNDLLQSAGVNNIFLTWDWLYYWWIFYKKPNLQLFIVSAWDKKGRLIGILPCYKQESRIPGIPGTIRFLGSDIVCSDYLDLILLPEGEREILEQIVRFTLRESNTIGNFILTDFDTSSKTMKHLILLLERTGIRYILRKGQVCPYIDLPGTLDEFHSTLSANMRSNIKRRSKQFYAQEGARFRSIDKDSEIDGDYGALFSLHEARWRSRGGKGDFQAENLRRFHLTLGKGILKKGWLRMYLLELDSKQIASLYCFEFGGKCFYYQGGFDPSQEKWSPGLILLSKGMEEAINRGNAEFDFLRGDDEYKWRWTKKYRETSDLVFYPDTIKGSIAYGISEIIGLLRSVKRRIAGKGLEKTYKIPLQLV